MIILEQDPTLRKIKLIQREELRAKKKDQKTVFAKIKKAYTEGMSFLRSEQAKELTRVHKRWDTDEKDLQNRLLNQLGE